MLVSLNWLQSQISGAAEQYDTRSPSLLLPPLIQSAANTGDFSTTHSPDLIIIVMQRVDGRHRAAVQVVEQA
jgi:hypothetical protein